MQEKQVKQEIFEKQSIEFQIKTPEKVNQKELINSMCNTLSSQQLENQYKMNLRPYCQIETQSKEQHQQFINLVNCCFCNFQNDKSNYECLVCGNMMKQYKMMEEQKKVKCQICGISVISYNFVDHYQNCSLSQIYIISSTFEEKRNCNFCGATKNSNEILQHQNVCSSFFSFQKHQQKINEIKQGKQQDRLTLIQLKALNYIKDNSKTDHEKAIPQLFKRVKTLGYQQQHLINLFQYVQHKVPIIIHIKVRQHLNYFLNDTHYRNLFQIKDKVNYTAGRKQKENSMFNNIYNDAKPIQRVKYGTINFTNDRVGVKAANSYGYSYFLLKNEVRYRCTVTNSNSTGAKNQVIGTFEHSCKILNMFNDKQLKAILDGSNQMQLGSQSLNTYRQIQIHGPIEFNKDIEKIFVSYNEVQNDDQLVKKVFEFSQKHHIGVEFI